jgi:hypothetical protein
MYKNATKCNETIGKWCKNKHGASKIIDTFETYQPAESQPLAPEPDKFAMEPFAQGVSQGVDGYPSPRLQTRPTLAPSQDEILTTKPPIVLGMEANNDQAKVKQAFTKAQHMKEDKFHQAKV